MFILLTSIVTKNQFNGIDGTDAISISLTLLELMIVIFAIGISILGIYGYNNIKSDIKNAVLLEISQEVDKIVTKKLKENLDKKINEENEKEKTETNIEKEELKKSIILDA